MSSIILVLFLVPLEIYIGAATFYLLSLALAYFTLPERMHGPEAPLNRFAILIPAHNEELLVETLCQSLLQVDYPKEKYEIFVISDNCSDHTAEICRQYPLVVLERNDPCNYGKGQALAWGLRNIPIGMFDAIFIVDADNYVGEDVLRELNKSLNKGEQAIQCYNAVGNRDDSWFTQVLYISRTIGNLLFHEAKYRLGLSSYLMGNGLCFNVELLSKKGWTAFSTGEDWEYYAQLVEDGITIAFSAKAKVFHQESRSLKQATSQRLRWSNGKIHVAKTLGLPLLKKGLKEKNWSIVDASLPLFFPNYSLQLNLTLLALGLSFLMPSSWGQALFVALSLCFLLGQVFLFLLGVCIAGSAWKVFRSVLYVPVFLIWKLVIDFSSLLGIYRNEKWVRTQRHKPEAKEH